MPTILTDERAVEITAKFFERMRVERLLSRDGREHYYRKPFVIAVLGFPGSGKSTAAAEFARLSDGVHVQTNSIRQLMRELNVAGEESVRMVRDLLVSELLLRHHAVILDANVSEETLQLQEIAREKRAKIFFVGITASLELAAIWARARFSNRPISTFKEWLPDPGKRETYISIMPPLQTRLHDFIQTVPDYNLLSNAGSKEDLQNSAREAWEGIKPFVS
jgi:predicted kinase